MSVKDLPAFLVIGVIRIYQKTISLDHGLFKSMYPNGYCKFYPTCSEYGVQALQKKGLIKGSYLISRRLLRCHPWAKPTIDRVPE